MQDELFYSRPVQRSQPRSIHASSSSHHYPSGATNTFGGTDINKNTNSRHLHGVPVVSSSFSSSSSKHGIEPVDKSISKNNISTLPIESIGTPKRSEWISLPSVNAALQLHSNGGSRIPLFCLVIRQQPERGLAIGNSQMALRTARSVPLDPPPVCELLINRNGDEQLLSLPEAFVRAQLVTAESPYRECLSGARRNEPLVGDTLQSAFNSRIDTKEDQSFFVFKEMGVRSKGLYRIRFDLFDRVGLRIQHMASVYTDPFEVQERRKHPGLTASTSLMDALVDRGMKYKLRKPINNKPSEKKRKPSHPDSPFETHAGSGPFRSHPSVQQDNAGYAIDEQLKKQQFRHHHHSASPGGETGAIMTTTTITTSTSTSTTPTSSAETDHKERKPDRDWDWEVARERDVNRRTEGDGERLRREGYESRRVGSQTTLPPPIDTRMSQDRFNGSLRHQHSNGGSSDGWGGPRSIRFPSHSIQPLSGSSDSLGYLRIPLSRSPYDRSQERRGSPLSVSPHEEKRPRLLNHRSFPSPSPSSSSFWGESSSSIRPTSSGHLLSNTSSISHLSPPPPRSLTTNFSSIDSSTFRHQRPIFEDRNMNSGKTNLTTNSTSSCKNILFGSSSTSSTNLDHHPLINNGNAHDNNNNKLVSSFSMLNSSLPTLRPSLPSISRIYHDRNWNLSTSSNSSSSGSFEK